MIGIATLVGGGAGSGPLRQICVRIPFTDQRAERVFKHEARQLPKQGIGFLMFDVANASGSFQAWESLVIRRFQPKMHRRVSGVCLFDGVMAPSPKGYSWLLRTKLITNTHARFKLPDWVKSTVASDGREYEHIVPHG